MTAPDTSAAGVERRVREWRRLAEAENDTATALDDACDLIDALACGLRCVTAERDDWQDGYSALATDLAEYRESADLRWRADQRAIAAWQAAGEGRALTWPDHADLCVWLLGERDRLAGELARVTAIDAGSPSPTCEVCGSSGLGPMSAWCDACLASLAAGLAP